LIKQVGSSPFTSKTLKQEVQATRRAIRSLERASNRVVVAGTAKSFYARDKLLGTVEVAPSGPNGRKLTVTRLQPNASSMTNEVFRTRGRGAMKLVVQEMAQGLRGKKPWNVVLNQIRGEMKHATHTAGSRTVEKSDIGRSERTQRQFRVERWLTRGRGVPKNAPVALKNAPARHRGKAVIGNWSTKKTIYRLDAGGNRIPHPDPEAAGRHIKDTILSQSLDYHVDRQGRPVFHAVAQ
jgi:hypothetical protein